MSTEIRHEPELLTVSEYALEMRVTGQTVRRWVREGRLEAVRTRGGQMRVPLHALPRLSRTRSSIDPNGGSR